MATNPPRQRSVSRNRDLYFLSFAFFIPLLMIWLVFISRSTSIDLQITAYLSGFVTESRTAWMKTISFLGNHKFLIPANISLILVLFLLKKQTAAWRSAVVALSSLGLMSLLKNLFRRQRPLDSMVDGITNFSFPSGHALMGVAFYGLLIWLTWKFVSHTGLRYTLTIGLVLLLLIIGFSRVYLRVHYTSDVIAGYGIGVCWLYAMIWVTGKKKNGSSGLVQETQDRPL